LYDREIVDQLSIEVRDFSIFQSVQGSSAHSLSYLTDKKALSPRVKQPDYELDRSHSPTVQFKNEWSCIFTPYAFIPYTEATVLYIILLQPILLLLLLLLLLLKVTKGNFLSIATAHILE
jgi:hypothetical protein